ncbi:hypothetical protein [Lysobacter enzymogenes]|uniref:hypothetical protein n=1 Tax=Lysobacter enzymogenes TaxID=69 RepID=UPI00099D932D|nr:hypothetical protein [Lysobacter enzymogenes]UZW58548.1 hypothetical protein BV903_014590 [Lysobacter enzymogenes]
MRTRSPPASPAPDPFAPAPEPALAATAQTAARDALAQWRELTRQANAAFDRRQLAHAQRLYRQALRVVDAPDWRAALAVAPDELLAARVVSHHNLAETHRRLRDPERAREQLCLAHEALTGIACDPRAGDAVRRCALRHLGRTRLALLDWQSARGVCARTQVALRESAAALARSDPGPATH